VVGDQERVARLLDIAGLELEALYGGFAREPFTDDSREYVFVTRRRRSSDLPSPDFADTP
jgi:hypothetical protein